MGVANPSLAGSYLRALLPKRKPGAWALAGMERSNVAVDAARLACYRRLCGFVPDTSEAAAAPVPATFPHLTAFPLAMKLMTRRGFPFPVLGLIHLANEIEQLEPLTPDQHLGYRVWIEKPREHAKGTAFDVLAEAHDAADGHIVWRATSTYLRRAKATAATAATRPTNQTTEIAPPSAGAEKWLLPADLGRQYGAVSGDRNPIHLHPATARPFGFRRPIAHGMWTAARCLAGLTRDGQGSLPDAFRLRVEFHAAVPLPSAVLFHSDRRADIRDFSLTSARTGRRHLHGELTPI